MFVRCIDLKFETLAARTESAVLEKKPYQKKDNKKLMIRITF